VKFSFVVLLAVVVSGCSLPRLESVYPLGAVYESAVPVQGGSVFLPAGRWRVFENSIYRHDNLDYGTRDEYAGLLLVQQNEKGKLAGFIRIIAGSTKLSHSDYHAVKFGLTMCDASRPELGVFYSKSLVRNLDSFDLIAMTPYEARNEEIPVAMKCLVGHTWRAGGFAHDWYTDLFDEEFGPLPTSLAPVIAVIRQDELYSVAVYVQVEQYKSVQQATDAATLWIEENSDQIFKQVTFD